MSLILPRRKLLRLAAPALILPHRRADAQVGLPWPGPGGVAGGAPAAWTLIASASASGSTGGTSGAVTTTTANAIYSAVGYFSGTPVWSDSKSNTWSQPSGATTVGGVSIQSFYCLSPTVGAGHTFTVSGAGIFAYFVVYAFKSATGTPFLDTSSTGGGQNSVTSGTTLVVTPVTPAHANDLILSDIVDNTLTNTYSLDNGFTTTIQVPPGSGANVGGALSWLIRGASSVTPTWTMTSATTAAAAQTFVLGSV